MNRLADSNLKLPLNGKAKPDEATLDAAFSALKQQAANNNKEIEAMRERELTEEGLWAIYVWWEDKKVGA